MSTKITINEVPRLEMVELGEWNSLGAYHFDHVGRTLTVLHIEMPDDKSIRSAEWQCRDIKTGDPVRLASTANVHPRPDIDAMLSAVEPVKKPEVETVALADVEDMEYYMVDGYLAQATELLRKPNRVFVRSVHFLNTKGKLVAFIETGNEFDHTIHAADVKITATPKMKTQ